jgi:hypothetical protein
MNDSERSLAAAQYTARLRRVMDAVALRRPDRVPVAFTAHFWPARFGGISFRQAMYDYDLAAEVHRRILLELEPDFYVPPHRIAWGPVFEIIGYRQLEWPGHGTGENVAFQYLDREYMKAEEYDDFLFDPTGFYLTKYLPRVAAGFEGFAELPRFPGIYYTRLVGALGAFAKPALLRTFETLRKAGEEADRLTQHMERFIADMAELGFPMEAGSMINSPLDYLGDYFRGSKNILLDLYRHRDKLIAAMDKALVFLARQAIAVAKASASKFVFIPLHWAPDGFMSPVQFKTIYWPPLQKLIVALIDNDLVPVVFWESDCTSRLETIGDIPKGKAIYWFERTNLVRAKEVLGGTVCLRGNVPASMLATGTPEQVDTCCRELIEKVGRDGGFILDGAIGIPDEAKTENVKAMFSSVRKYQA